MRPLTLFGDCAPQASLESRDGTASTPLHVACALGRRECAVALLKAGASPRAEDAEGLTPLHLAAAAGHAAIVDDLIAHWAPLEAAAGEEEGAAAAHAPPRRRDTRVAARGAMLHIASRGAPLHVAVASGAAACVARLLCAGASTSSPRGPRGATPLHTAARLGDVGLCVALLDAGCPVDAVDEEGEAALHRACHGGHAPVVALLLHRGASATAASSAGMGPLHIAALGGRVALFGPLVSGGARVDAPDATSFKDGDGRRTPLMHAAHFGNAAGAARRVVGRARVSCARPPPPAAFAALLSLGATPRLLSSCGWPPLFYCAEASVRVAGRDGEANRHLALLRAICDADADAGVWCTDPGGRTALAVAAGSGAHEAVALLAAAHPWSVDYRDERGRTPAHWAAARGHTACLEALLAARCDVSATDADGRTPGQLLPLVPPLPRLRAWAAERAGAAGGAWDEAALVEASAFRYAKKAALARRARQAEAERQCAACGAFSFQTLRCGGCRAASYCGVACQKAHWASHALVCAPPVALALGAQATQRTAKQEMQELNAKPF